MHRDADPGMSDYNPDRAWAEATAKVREIAGTLPIYWEFGNTIYTTPHVIVWTKDAWSGEGIGYNVNVYPEGGGYMKPCQHHSVPLRRTP